MKFYCQDYLVEHLQKQAKEMEDELKKWNDKVSVARKEFYELNYYTTHQLLILRRELGKLRNSGQTTQQAQVMALLESISMQITPTIVGEMHQITTQVSEEKEESNRPRSPISQGIHPPNSEIIFHASPHPSDHHDVVQPAVKCSGSLCQVSLSRKMLSAKQDEHFTNIIEVFHYNEMTALKAIEMVGNGDWNDIYNWLQKNADKFEQQLLLQDYQGEEEKEQMSDSEGEEEQMSDSEEEEEQMSDSEEELVLDTNKVYSRDILSEFTLLRIWFNSVSSMQIYLPSPL